MSNIGRFAASGFFAVVLVACGSADDPAPSTTHPLVEAGITSTTTLSSEASEPSILSPPAEQAPAIAGVPTSYDQLLIALQENDGAMTPELAMTAFAMQFGEVPGAMRFPADGSQPQSGTGALRWVYGMWDDLTDEQRAAVSERIDGPIAGEEQALGEGASRVAFRSLLAQSAEEEEYWEALADYYSGELRARLGGPALVYDLRYGVVTDGGAETGPGTFMNVRLLGSNSSCTITVDIDEVRGMTEATQRSAIAHEMFHCWSLMNGVNALAWYQTPDWYQEGIASWVGETLAGGSNYSRFWWPGYLLPRHPELRVGVYAIDYQAIGFWSAVDNAVGGRLWDAIPTLNTIAGAGSDEQVFEAALALTGPEGMARIPAGATLRPEWGSSWTMTGPGIRGAGRQTRDFDVSIGSPASTTVLNSEQRLETFHIVVDDLSEPHIVQVEGQGLMLGRWNTSEELLVTGPSQTFLYCVGECTCSDGASLAPDAVSLGIGSSALTVALTGGATSSSKVGVSVSVLEESCEDSDAPPALNAPSEYSPSALFGTWRASPEAIVNMFNASFAHETEGDEIPPLEVLGVNGHITITFFEDRSAEILYDGLELILEAGSPVPSITIDGGGAVEWRRDGFLVVFSGESEFDLVASADVLGSEIEFPISNVDVATRDGESRFVVNLEDPSLNLNFVEATYGRIFFPTSWTRVSD